MKTKTLSAMAGLVLAFSSVAAESKIYYWKTSSGDWLSFAEPGNWAIGTSADGEAATGAPGADDWLHYTTGYANSQYMDMGGQGVSVKGIDYTSATYQYGYRNMGVRNGSLTFTDSFRTRRVKMTVASGGAFATAATCTLTTEWGGAENVFTVKDGGSLSFAGTMNIGNLRVTNEAGGVVVIDPASFTLTDQGGATCEAWFDNSGAMSFPNGLSVGATSGYGANHGCDWPFVLRAGTMTVGGPFKAAEGTTLYNDFTFDLRGGTLAVVGDVSMPLFASVGMLTADTTAAIDIAEGKTLDWSNAWFAEGTTLNVTGTGTLILGTSWPTALNLGENVKFGRPSRNFIWKGGASLRSVPDYANWSTSWDETLENWEASDWSNAEKLAPGADDFWLYGRGATYRKFLFDLGGTRCRIGGLFGDDGTGANFAWDYHDMLVTNGTLEIVHTFTNRFILGKVEAGAAFVLGSTSVSRLGKDGASNVWTVVSGGELRYLGAIQVNNAVVNVRSGARCVLDPTRVDFDEGARDDIGRGVFSEGTLEIPNGFAMGSVNTSSAVTEARQPWWTIRSAGALVLGGDVSFSPSGDHGIGKVCFDVLGGTMSVTKSAAFLGLESVTFTNAEVSVSLAEGATLSLTNATFGSGVALRVSGKGTLALGRAFPATLELGEGTTLSFEQGGAALGTILGAEKAKFTIGPAITRRTVLAESADATLLNAMAANSVPPEGMVVLVDGQKLVARRMPKGLLFVVR